ncbi:MAG: hypothetical protein ABI903_02780 [Actinomycetota bacterium]
MNRHDLITTAAGTLGLRRDDLVRIARVMAVTVTAVVCIVTLTSVPGWGATHALLGIHQPPAARTSSAPMTVNQARKILARTFTAAYLGETKKGAAAKADLRTAYARDGLRAVNGRVRLASVQPAAEASPLLAPHPTLLAISRGFGFPRFLLAQTQAADGSLPILHLLVSPDAVTPYRIYMSVEMVPPATVSPFDPVTSGSPLVSNDAGPQVKGGAGLAVAPSTLLKLYAANMAFPAKHVTKPPFAADPFASQVTAGAAAVAGSVASQASFKQVHTVLPSSVYAVRQANGDGLVFGVIERKDSFTVKAGENVRTAANKAFVLLTGDKVITKSASITTLEFVVFAVPRSTGNATLVAAREQIVAGSGS